MIQTLDDGTLNTVTRKALHYKMMGLDRDTFITYNTLLNTMGFSTMPSVTPYVLTLDTVYSILSQLSHKDGYPNQLQLEYVLVDMIQAATAEQQEDDDNEETM